jgi:outer membrane protein assembly factor BamB
MSYDGQENFEYTGSPQTWKKPEGVTSVFFIVKGAGGGGNISNANGGGGAYVFANYTNLVRETEYDVTINIGSGGQPPLSFLSSGGAGGISIGGQNNNNGGNGSIYNNLQSGGGGSMTSVIYNDPCGNKVIQIIAGGGGGAGINGGANGGNGGEIGITGSGTGGGPGGNTGLNGGAGLGGVIGGANGYNYIDSNLNGNYIFLGGGGGNGGTFAGGGGGAGYGGGASGNQGDGGGGGGSFTLPSVYTFVAGAGGAGGGPNQNGVNGSVSISWIYTILEKSIVEMFMLNAQHTCKSIYTSATIKPEKESIFDKTKSKTFPNSAVIGANDKLYIIAGDGLLYAFNSKLTSRLSIPFLAPFNCTFIGTPAINGYGTLYISATSTAQNYLFAVNDNGTGETGQISIKWKYPLDGNSVVSPTLDLNLIIYIGTINGSIYAIKDNGAYGIPLWVYSSPDKSPITSAITLDLSFKRLFYTTSTLNSSSLFAIDISGTLVKQRWTRSFTNEICGTPSVDKKNNIYVITNTVNTNNGTVYYIDSSGGSQLGNNIPINGKTRAKNIAIDNSNNFIYVTSQGNLYIIDTSNQMQIPWLYSSDINSDQYQNTIPIIDGNNNVLFGSGVDSSNNNFLYSVNPLNHIVNWKYQTTGAVQSMPIINKNGNIYFGANDGKIYDLGGNGSPLNPTTPSIVSMYMLNAQNTCQSPYSAPTILPTTIKKQSTNSRIFSNNGVISSDPSNNKLYIISDVSDNGLLYAFNEDFSNRWTSPFSVTSLNCKFIGTPAVAGNGTLYIAATSSTQNYLFAIEDTDNTNNIMKGTPSIQWQLEIDGTSSVSPIIDLSGTIYIGTNTGSIYAIADIGDQGLPLWNYISPDQDAIAGTLALNLTYDKLFYTTATNLSSTLFAIQLIPLAIPTPLWEHTFIGEICGTPSIDQNNNIYVITTMVDSVEGNIYAFAQNGSGTPFWITNEPLPSTLAKNIAIDNTNNFIYFISMGDLVVINMADGSEEWTYLNDIQSNQFNNTIPVIDASSNIYFATGADNFLYSINPVYRTFNWRFQVDGIIQSMPIIGSNGHIYFGANDGNVYDLAGTINARIPLPGSPPLVPSLQKPPIIPPSSAIVPMYMMNPQHTGIAKSLGPVSLPTTKWSADFVSGSLFISPSIAIGSDGTLYIGSKDGFLYAINPNTGNFIPGWPIELEENPSNSSLIFPKAIYTTPAIGPDGTIYVGSNEGKFYALDRAGNIKWTFVFSLQLQSSPVIDIFNNIYLCVGSHKIVIGDADYQGYSKWNILLNTGNIFTCSPAVGFYYSYIGADDGFVYAMNSINGDPIWRFNTGLPILSSATVDSSNNVIIGNGSHTDGFLFYLDGIKPLGDNSPNRVIWRWPTVGDNMFDFTQRGSLYNTVAVKGNTIYLSTLGYIYAINRLTGLTLYRFAKANFYYSSPIIDTNGTIYVTSINARTGRGILHSIIDTGLGLIEKWQLDVDPTIQNTRFSPPVIDNNGTIYISSTGNKIYAIK